VKKTIWLLLIICVLFSLVDCSKKHVRIRPVILYERVEEITAAEPEEITLENNYLLLRFLTKTAEIILKDKINGTEWHSTPVDFESDASVDVVTGQMIKSQFAMQYSDVSGVGETLYSNTQSIERGFYEYELIDDSIEVRYTIGNLERSFLIPPAMPEARMSAYMDQIDSENTYMIEASYRLVDINDLLPNENRGAMLSQYPDLSREKLFILRDNTREYMKEMLEDIFAEIGYTRENYYEDIARYTASGGSDRPAFNVVIRYSLDGKSLVVTVPFDKISYRPAYPVVRLDILPFMGAGGLNDEGYILVPDGSGAIINFNNGKYNQIAYNIGVYGWDEAMPRDAVISDNKAAFPAFGIHKNEAALLCVIEEGSAYANVRADVSGRNCSYNSVYPWFTMVHGAIMDISGRSDRAVYLYEKELPPGENIVLRYTVCEESGYMGMAKEYRSWLLGKYPSLAGRKTGEMPVAVELVGAVNKTQHRLGIPVDRPLKLTSYKEMEEIIDDFTGYGWKNVHVKINGWFNRSVDHSVPSKIKLINELGSRKNFKDFVEAVKNNNYKLYPEADFLFIKDVKFFSPYSLYRDSARYVSRKRIEKYPYSFVWFGERIQWGKLSQVARPASMMSIIDSFVQKSSKLGIENIAYRNIGAKLSGDYHEKRLVSREAAMKMRYEKLAELNKAGRGAFIHTGFEYTVPWADIITDIPVNDQSFGITDSAVPFYQIALHGLVPYTGRAINLAEDYSKNLLKSIESGAGLYFSFMMEDTALLQETKFRQFYANEYRKWIGDADSLYRKFSSQFSHLYSQSIVDHQILAPGVTLTGYEDGTRIIVNISGNSFNFNGNNVNKDDYIMLRRGE
jgi:hypothetical protein